MNTTKFNLVKIISSKDIHLTKDEFSNELEKKLTILREPSKRKRFYLCRNEFDNSLINVFIKK